MLSDSSQSDAYSDDPQEDSELDEDDDDDPLSGKTFDMSDDEAAEDQSIPSGDEDDSPDDSPPEAPAEAGRQAKALVPKGEAVSSLPWFSPLPAHITSALLQQSWQHSFRWYIQHVP